MGTEHKHDLWIYSYLYIGGRMSKLGRPLCRECGSSEIEPDCNIALCESCYGEMYGLCYTCEETVPVDELNEDMCQSCHEHHYCECGIKLEDSMGTPGDGMCRKCD